MLKLFRVEGQSMAPYAKEGDFVLIYTFFSRIKSKPGDWFVFDHPSFGLLLKECVTINAKTSTFRTKSLNSQGLPENKMGNIHFSKIKGKVWWVISS